MSITNTVSINNLTNLIDNKVQETKSEMGKTIEELKGKVLANVENIKTKFQPLADKAGNLKTAFENNLSQFPTLVKNIGSTVGVAGLIAFIPAVIATGGLATIIPLIAAACLLVVSTAINLYDCVSNHKGAGEFFKTMFTNTIKGIMLGMKYKNATPEQQEKLLKEIGDIFIGDTKKAAIDFAQQLKESCPETYKTLFKEKEITELGLSDIANAIKGAKDFKLGEFQTSLKTIANDVADFQNAINDFQAHESLQNTLIGFFKNINSGEKFNIKDIPEKLEQCITKNLCESIKTKLTDQILAFFQQNTKLDNDNLTRIKNQINTFFKGSSKITSFESLQELIQDPKNLFENCIKKGSFTEEVQQNLLEKFSSFQQGLNLPTFDDLQGKINKFITEKFPNPSSSPTTEAIKDFITENCKAFMLQNGTLEEKIQSIFDGKDLMSSGISKLNQLIENHGGTKNKDLDNLMKIADQTLGKTDSTSNEELREKLAQVDNSAEKEAQKLENMVSEAKPEVKENAGNLLNFDDLVSNMSNNPLSVSNANTNSNSNVQVNQNSNNNNINLLDFEDVFNTNIVQNAIVNVPQNNSSSNNNNDFFNFFDFTKN